jgi:PAS domain S-box-containing protein
MLSAEHADSQLVEFAFESLPTACLIKNGKLEYCRINRTFCAFLGMDPADLIGKTAHDFLDEKTARQFEGRERKVLETGECIEFEETITGADGRKIDILTQIDRIAADNGEHFICVNVTDVTELKSAIREQETQTELLQESATAMAQGLMVFGAEEIEFVSAKTCELLEVPAPILTIGNKWTSLHELQSKSGDNGTGPEAETLLELVQINIRNRIAQKLEHQTPSGSTLLLDHVPRKGGGAIVTVTDISDSTKIAQELAQSKNRAETADRAKSEFLANMSHEIRTPMNGVMGMAELLARTKLDDKQKMFTDVIVNSAASLLTIINDILDFSKIDAGQMELDPAPFSLGEAIEDVATLMSSGAAEKDLELIVRVDPELPDVMIGDVGRIRQIVTNLLGNAIKFTGVGHVYVNVDGTVESAGDLQSATLKFVVQDTGIGIPPDKLQRVFEKFSQVDSSATRKHEGTGLGLAIASSLVHLMDGQMGVDSEEGAGSSFWFEITLPVSAEAKSARPVPVHTSGARVLVVDDNVVNRSILTEQMAAWNFDSAAAVNGREALAVMRAATARDISVNCVVLDYHMPEMNGADVVRAMRQDSRLADIPVIMLTSVDQTEDGKTFSSLGVQGHLTKPARSAVLLEMMLSVLHQDQSRKTSPQPEDANNVGRQSDRTGPMTAPPQEAEDECSEGQQASDRIDILVCEDNEVNQIVFTQILQEIGLTFHIAKNGEEGVVDYKRLRPSIVIMDVSMPLMNGYEATQEIRNAEARTGFHTPIIGVTAHAIPGDMEKCIDAGMDDYLSKPVSLEKLTVKIDAWMDGRSENTSRKNPV